MDATRGEEVGRGMIVAVGSGSAGPRAADLNIANMARETGVYRPSAHLEQATANDRLGGDPEAFIRSHVRRLEALRRAGLVERIDADHWRIPTNLPERGQVYDQSRNGGNIRIGILSPTGVDHQVRHDGATRLDRELASRQRIVLANEGFGLEVQAALAQRRQWLVDMGYATNLGDGRIRGIRDLIKRLESADVDRAGKALAVQRGRKSQPAVPGYYVMGELVGSIRLSSGRFAMIDDGLGFSRRSRRSSRWRAVSRPAHRCRRLRR